jgi:hypothetical protein
VCSYNILSYFLGNCLQFSAIFLFLSLFLDPAVHYLISKGSIQAPIAQDLGEHRFEFGSHTPVGHEYEIVLKYDYQ